MENKVRPSKRGLYDWSMGDIAVDKLHVKAFQWTKVLGRHNQSADSLSLRKQFPDQDVANVTGSPRDDYHLIMISNFILDLRHFRCNGTMRRLASL
jgi:hypothetical protein